MPNLDGDCSPRTGCGTRYFERTFGVAGLGLEEAAVQTIQPQARGDHPAELVGGMTAKLGVRRCRSDRWHVQSGAAALDTPMTPGMLPHSTRRWHHGPRRRSWPRPRPGRCASSRRCPGSGSSPESSTGVTAPTRNGSLNVKPTVVALALKPCLADRQRPASAVLTIERRRGSSSERVDGDAVAEVRRVGRHASSRRHRCLPSWTAK